MTDMKVLNIDGVEYEIIDEEARNRLTTAEGSITGLQSSKADGTDIPSKVSDLENDAGFITDALVEDVKIDGTSIVTDKAAVIPRASASKAGVLKFDPEATVQRADIYTDQTDPYMVPLLNENQLIAAAQLPAATTSTKGAMSAEDKAKLNGIIGTIYPVGAVYISATEVDPAVLFGGTWAQIKDVFLFAAGDNAAEWFALKADSTMTANSIKVYMWKRIA